MAVILNASTSSGFVQSADTSGEINLQSNGTTRLSVLSTGVSGTIIQGTVNAGGTNPFPSSLGPSVVDFTGIPSWVKRITVMFAGVSTNSTSVIQIQLGDSGGIETTGYLGAGGFIQNAGASGVTNFTSGFAITSAVSAASVYHGSMTITLIGSNVWVANGAFARSDSIVQNFGQGSKTLSDTLDRVRITTVNGTDVFDAGSINIQYEG
jgi:hypothetical protein